MCSYSLFAVVKTLQRMSTLKQSEETFFTPEQFYLSVRMHIFRVPILETFDRTAVFHHWQTADPNPVFHT
jgi:hypothetical protein